MPVLVSIDDLLWITHMARNTLDEEYLILDGHRTRSHHRLVVVRPRSDSVNCPPSRLNPHKIVAQIIELLLDPRLPGFSDGDHADDRRDPDRYTQDRQHASHLVPKQRHQRRLQQCRVIQVPPLLSAIPDSEQSKINGR